MKRIAIAVSGACLVLAVSFSAQTPAQPNEEVEKQYALKKRMSPDQELIKLENEWRDALVKHDWALLDQILADDCIWRDPEGNVWTKAQFLASFKSGEDVLTAAEADKIRVRVFGDAA